MNKSFLLGTSVIVALAILVSLGTWQVQRLAWKTALIERLENRIDQPPIPLQKAIEIFLQEGEVEYQPVTVRGRFLHDSEKHLYTLNEAGRPGWHIYTLMETKGSGCASCLNQNRYIYINRGFVPIHMKTSDKRSGGQISGEVELVGLVRIPRTHKTYVEAENRPDKNEWYWPSLNEMSTPSARLSDGIVTQLAPLFVDERAPASANTKSYKWPRAGTTRIKLTNNHLGYVITWYGLALALLGVYGFFLYGKRRESIEGS